MSQPLMTFTIEPPDIYAGDVVTLRWDVRNKAPGVAWPHAVHVRSSFAINPRLPDPAPKTGFHTFKAGEQPDHGIFTVETQCGSKTSHYGLVRSPRINGLSAPKGGVGTPVRLEGNDFGERGVSGNRVDLLIEGRTLEMPVQLWSNTAIDVKVPDGAPVGEGKIRVRKGPRQLLSNTVLFKVGRMSKLITAAMVEAVARDLRIGDTRIHLDGRRDSRTNGSQVHYSAPMNLGSDRDFTLPPGEGILPQDASIATTAVLRGGRECVPERVNHFVNPVDSDSTKLDLAQGQIVMTIGFDRQRTRIRNDVSCAGFGWYETVRTAHFTNAVVTVRLTPAASGGNFTFSSATVSFVSGFETGPDWEDWISRGTVSHGNKVIEEVNSMCTATFSAGFYRSVGDAFMNHLRTLGVRKAISVSTTGGNIFVEYE